MSHWHRAPRAVSVRSLVQRYAKCILLDRTIEVPAGNLKALSMDIQAVCAIDPGGKLSLVQVARLCQEMCALLITTSAEVIPMLIADGRAFWGAVLVPLGRTPQAEVLERLAANQLNMSPSAHQELMAEYVARNRLLIDLRSSKPSIGVFCNCRWNRP
jgi:hypothetical protein